jgi:hypothetical protein
MFPVVPETRLVGAVDARDILPVQDEHGGVTIYYRGRPSLYMLAGEWYRASPEPEAFGQATSTVVDHFLAQPGSRHNPID